MSYLDICIFLVLCETLKKGQPLDLFETNLFLKFFLFGLDKSIKIISINNLCVNFWMFRFNKCNMIGKFTVKRKHIQQDHWNWPQCHICYDVIEQEKMANHLRHKHGQV